MKRWKKVSISIVLVLAAVIAALAIWQRENLKAVYTFLTNDSETISNNLEDKRQELQKQLEEDFNVTIVAPDIDQSNDLLDGKVTPEEVKGALGITQALEDAEKKETTALKQETASEEQKPEEEQTTVEAPVQEPQPEIPEKTEPDRQTQIDSLVNQCVAELYACEVDLMAHLGVMKQAAIAEWRALEKAERTYEKKLEIGMAGLEKCYDLEVEIDEQVEEILNRYRGPLEELQADMTVLDNLWVYYCNKKADQKAYYLDKYLED